MNVEKYIYDNWSSTVRYVPDDAGDVIGLPYPYTVPGLDEKIFNELYYWDTYFTNAGLILSNNIEQAKNNVDNILYLVKKFGFMPNANRQWAITRSQPPFLSFMVKDIYEQKKDRAWLKDAYALLRTEYEYWQGRRSTPSGLNRYYGENKNFKFFADLFCDRLKIEKTQDEETICEYAQSFQSGAEGGWDFSSRCGLSSHEFNWVDLNSLMYGFEKNMAEFSSELALNETEKWNNAAEKRLKLINELMWNEERGAFFDYDFVNKKQGKLLSVATYYPLFVGLATAGQAERIVKTLDKLEQKYGIAASEYTDDILNLQWDYPNGWPCLQFIAVKGLFKYGYENEAKRIAQKYIDVVDRNFERTHQLWEKYDILSGEISVSKEYKTPPMLGWTGGTYLYCKTKV